MYYDWIQQNKRIIIRAAWAFLALVIVWALWTYIDRVGKTPLTIAVVPSDAKVVVDGKDLGGGTHWLVDGTYTVKVEKSGFNSQDGSVIVSNKKEQNVAAFSLTPASDEAKKWADKHQSDYSRNEQFGSIQAKTEGKYFSDQNPIVNKLPFTDPYFTIGYRTDDNNTVVLIISTPSPRYRFYALEKVREFGYDPTNFIIEFKDFRNPLGQK